MFRQAIKSDKTFYSYRYELREFLKYVHLSSFDEITTVEPNVIQGILKNWIMDLSAKGIKGSTTRVKLAPVELSWI